MTRRSLALTLSILAGSVIFFAPQTTLASCCKCTDGPIQNLCLTIDAGGCGSLTTNYPANPNLASLQCASLPDEQCKTVADGGQCASVAYARAYGISKNLNVESATATAPVLNVPIPGVHFSEQLRVEGGVAQIPYFMEYISGIYLYLLGLSVIAATIVIVYGGTLYILGSTFASIDSGKKLIQDALIGLVLLFSANTILATLNPGLVTFHPLNIAIVSRDDAYLDEIAERNRVQDAATANGSADEEVPIIDSDGTPLSNSEELPPGTAPKQGIVTNAQGDFVAQHTCPSDMKAIPKSDAYEQKMKPSADQLEISASVPSFCMDTYEAPNIRGRKPFNGVENYEADWYCHAHGKRLCTSSEWTRACLGPEGVNTYGYGPDYIPGRYISARIPQTYSILARPDNKPAPCNYDSPSPANSFPNGKSIHQLDYFITQEDHSFLKPSAAFLASTLSNPFYTTVKIQDAYNTLKTALDRVSSAEPSGSRSLCFSAEGVYDLPANVQEIVVTDIGGTFTTKERTAAKSSVGEIYSWAGQAWDPIAHLANTSALPNCTNRWGGGAADPHDSTWRAFENGFRCCLDLQE